MTKLKNYPYMLFALTILLTATIEKMSTSHAFEENSRLELQLALKLFIDSKTTNGAYNFFDVEMGAVRNLKLLNLHPVIFEKDGYYMMCADFLDRDMVVDVDQSVDWTEEKLLIDYIIIAADGRFIVEQEVLGKRSILTSIFRKLQ